MGLREVATSDLNLILATDFGLNIDVTNPDGVTAAIIGFTNDIAQTIDPDTGQIVSGRIGSVALSFASLDVAGFGLPQGVSELTKKPWLVEFLAADANLYKFKVIGSNPDRALGIVTCELELYDD
jgi:hypothetical protein